MAEGAFGSPSEGQQKANAAASLENLLVSWQIDITPEVRSFILKAVNANMSAATFMKNVRQTKFYAQRFPGIMRPNGTLRMTESQYISGYESSRDYAASLGRNLSQQMYGQAVKNGNSPSEIRQKLEAVDKLRTYAPLYRNVADYLVATGVVKKPPTKKEMLQFALGKGDKAWNDAFRTAVAATQVESMGFNVAKPALGGDIGFKGLSKMAAEIEALGAAGDYTGVLDRANKVLGAGDWKDMGVSNKDKVALALGTRSAAKIVGRVQDAVNARIASLEGERAAPNLVQGPRGTQMTTGVRPTQASE